MTGCGGAIDVHAHYLAPRYRDALEASGPMIGGIPIPPWTPEGAIGSPGSQATSASCSARTGLSLG